MVTFERHLQIPLTCVEGALQLLNRLRRMEEGETKVDVIADEYLKTLDAFGQQVEEKYGNRPVFMIHGILKFDYSFPPTNVGVLPEELEFRFMKASLKDEFIYELGDIDTDIFIRLFPMELFIRTNFEDKCIAVYPNGFALLNIPEPFLRGPPFLGISGLVSTVLGDVSEENDLDILRQVYYSLFSFSFSFIYIYIFPN